MAGKLLSLTLKGMAIMRTAFFFQDAPLHGKNNRKIHICYWAIFQGTKGSISRGWPM